MMHPVALEPFVKALRSGDYKQGLSVLSHVGPDGVERHCALGVLCEVAMAAGVKIEKREATHAFLEGDFLYDDQVAFLPESVMKWSGLSKHQSIKILNMSDNGVTFKRIADYVEGS